MCFGQHILFTQIPICWFNILTQFIVLIAKVWYFEPLTLLIDMRIDELSKPPKMSPVCNKKKKTVNLNQVLWLGMGYILSLEMYPHFLKLYLEICICDMFPSGVTLASLQVKIWETFMNLHLCPTFVGVHKLY